MSRPIGSKNKPKEVKEVDPVKFTSKSDIMPPVKVSPSPVEWKPAPDMGAIKPPPEGDKTCGFCVHKGALHYGSVKRWCNTGGCNCQEFK